MHDEKSILDKIEEKAKEIGKTIEGALDDLSADEERLKITYPEPEPEPKADPKTKADKPAGP